MATTKKTKKPLSRTLYVYTRPVNKQWVNQNYKKYGFSSRSEFVDSLIGYAREGGFNFGDGPGHTYEETTKGKKAA